jgi:hypothetical protein
VNEHNDLLAGIPRSGTTLACELLNLLPDTVALDEPMRVTWLTGKASVGELPRDRPARDTGGEGQRPDPDRICDEVDRFLRQTRETIENDKTAVSQQVEGRVYAGKWAEDEINAGVRTALASRGEIEVAKELSPQFLLVVKHTGAFTALLESLVRRFRVYAIVRNPLAVLSSWETIPFPAREGRHQVAEAIEPELADVLEATEDRLDRQLRLLSWFFAKYRDFLPDRQIVRYEDMVGSRGRALAAITPHARELDQPLEDRNDAAVYDRDTMRSTAERLLESDGAYWDFYTRASVEELLRRAQSARATG